MKKLKIAALLTAFCLTAVTMSNITANPSSVTVKPFLKVKSLNVVDTPSGYTPAQIKKAYGIDHISGTGKGQTIALIVVYGDQNITSDVAAFSNTFNLPQANITVKNMSSTPNAPSPDASWALETALDTEWAHAIAPDAKLLVCEAASEDSDDLLAAVDYATQSGAQVVSMSWGGSETFSQTADDSHFVHSGTVYLAASGDDGAGAEWPSSSPNVIAVGGTTLNLDASGDRLTETAWSGSGGGSSFVESEPQWQKTMGIRSSFFSGRRVAPDVSFDADPNTGVSVYCSVPQANSSGRGFGHKSSTTSGWFTIGGTSLSSPSWAGIIADVNQNGTVIKNAASLYTMAGGTSYTDSTKAFNDVTVGSNGIYRAAKGFDSVTGLGSPAVNNFPSAVTPSTAKAGAPKTPAKPAVSKASK